MVGLGSRIFFGVFFCFAAPFSLAAPLDVSTPFEPREFADFEGALGGKIPFPPENLVQSLLNLDSNSRVIAEIFPHGRSFERAVTDFRNPRTVLAWRSASTLTPYYLYFGYTPNLGQLEVVAWNWSLRQFDFKLVTDYAPGKVPKIKPVSRALCMSCHQNGGPIFSQAPWSETTAGSSVTGRLKEQIEESFAQWIFNLDGPQNRVRRDAALYDAQVQNGAQFLQRQKICREACGGDLECRKGILFTALLRNHGRISEAKIPSDLMRAMREGMGAAWPKNQFGVSSHQIRNRNVNLSEPSLFMRTEDPLRWRELSIFRLEASKATTGASLAAFAGCWSFSEQQGDFIRSMGASQLRQALDTEYVKTVLTDWVPAEEKILFALRESLRQPVPASPGRFVSWQPVSEFPAPESDLSRPSQKSPELFRKYCASCHSGPGTRPAILPLADLRQLSLYQGAAGRTVRELLDFERPLMPPRGAPQPTVQERKQMISDLQ